MPEQPTEPSHVERGFFAISGPASLDRSRSFRQRRNCGERAGLREARFGRKRDQGRAFVAAEGIGLVVPIEKMRIRPNGVMAVLGGVMVGEKAFRFFVDATTFEIGPCSEENAPHYPIRSNLRVYFNLNA